MAAWDNVELPRAPTSYGPTPVDFSAFANLGNSFFQGAENRQKYDLSRTFAEGLPKDASGNIDFKAAAEQLAKRGAIDQIVPLANLDLQRQGIALGQQAAAGLAGGNLPGMTPIPGAAPTGAAPAMPAGPAPVNASVAGPLARPVTNPGQGDQAGSTMDVVSQAVPPEKAGFVATRIAAQLGIDPNAPLSPAQRAQLVTALEGGGYRVPGGAPAAGNGAPAAPAAPAATPVAMAAPGIPAAPAAAGGPASATASPAAGEGSQPGAIADPTLGGLVPQQFIQRYGPDRAAGEYQRWLRGMAAGLKTTPGAAGASEAYEKAASDVATALQKASEPTPGMKEFAVGRRPGESFTQFEARRAGEKKTAEVGAENEALPADMRGYNQAKQMGFRGSFEDWRQRTDRDRTELAILEKSVLPRLDKSYETAAGAREEILAMHRAREQLDTSGGIISGATAEGRLQAAKLLQLVPAFGDLNEKQITNTESFRAAVGARVQAAIKALPGPASDKDIAFAKGVAGGDIAINESSLRRIMDLGERAARERLASHERLVAQSARTNPILKEHVGAYAVQPPGQYGQAPAPQGAPAATPAAPGTARAAAAALPAPPQPGDVRAGYQFVGGNPADPASWRRQQ